MEEGVGGEYMKSLFKTGVMISSNSSNSSSNSNSTDPDSYQLTEQFATIALWICVGVLFIGTVLLLMSGFWWCIDRYDRRRRVGVNERMLEASAELVPSAPEMEAAPLDS